MYKTEAEMMSQHIAIKQTVTWFRENQSTVSEFFKLHPVSKFIVVGSGSSMMVAKSAASLLWEYNNSSGIAISGGDFMLAPEQYRSACEGGAILFLSRSGQTTEILDSAEYAKKHFHSVLISITVNNKNSLSEICDLNISLPWAFDHAVCQTRTVSNLYIAVILLIAIKNGDEKMLECIESAAMQSENFMNHTRPLFSKIAAERFDNVVALADGVVGGIAEEGTLAFQEIAILPASQFNLLDFRHGPIVLCNDKTVVFALLRDENHNVQLRMVEDILYTGCTLVTFSSWSCVPDKPGRHFHVQLPKMESYPAYGIFFLNGLQMTALARALCDGHNPDEPPDLSAYIQLDQI